MNQRVIMRRKEAILPKTYRPPSGDPERWFVYFSVYDSYTDSLKRFRRHEGFKKCKTVLECEKNAAKLKRRYTERLRKGWNPLEDNRTVIWSDNLEYQEVTKHIKPVRKTKKTIPYYLSGFLKKISKNLAYGSMQKYQSELRIFKNWCIEKKINKLDISTFTRKEAEIFFIYLEVKRKLGGTSRNNYTRTLRRVWEFARKDKKLLEDPWSEIPKYKEITKAQRPLKKGVISLLKAELKQSDPQLWLAAQFLYYCFVRPGELRFMQIKHLDLEEGKIMLTADITKPSKNRIVDVDSDFLVRLFSEYKLHTYPESHYVFTVKKEPGIKPIGKNYFWEHFNSVRKNLNLSRDYNFYGFKHTGAVAALKAGADIKDIQNQMGHSSVAITDEYLKSMVGYESEFFKNKMPGI